MKFHALSMGILCSQILSAVPAGAQISDPIFIIENQVGQATGHTCQSYVLAIALAFKRDTTLPLKSWRNLRDLEMQIRTQVVKSRDERLAGVPERDRLVSPADSDKAVRATTNEKYTLQYKTFDLPGFGNFVGAETGITTKVGLSPSFILGSLAKDVVISSAKKIGDTTYNSGHQFSIIGVSGPPNSTREYLVLNSAAYKARGTPAFNSCQGGLPDDPGPYFPSLSWRNDIEWNLDGGKIRAMTIEKR